MPFKIFSFDNSFPNFKQVKQTIQGIVCCLQVGLNIFVLLIMKKKT